MNGTLLGQTKGNDTIVFLYDEKANRYGFDYNGTKYYYIFNVQGDVIGILNQAGQKIVSYTYDPWGKVLSVDGSEASTIGQLNPIRYRGYYYDTENGFERAKPERSVRSSMCFTAFWRLLFTLNLIWYIDT